MSTRSIIALPPIRRRGNIILLASIMVGILILGIFYTQGMHEKLQAVYQGQLSLSLSIAATTNLYYQVSEHDDTTFRYSKVQYSIVNDIAPQSSQPSKDAPTLLIISAIGNSMPYGKDRTFADFIHTINSLSAHQDSNLRLNLGFLSNDPDEFTRIKAFINEEQEVLSKYYEKITIVLAPFLDENVGFDRHERQLPQFQRLRRRLIAKSRNFLLLNVLQDEQYTLFVDTDIVSFEHPERIISTFINSHKDIIVPRITKGENHDYDKNSWRGERTKPTQEELDLMDQNKWNEWDYVPYDTDNIWHFATYMNDVDDEQSKHKDDYQYIVPLDSVGGAVLFAKSIVYKQGAIFPTSNIVGTSWDRSEGYDGIETEGLCYLARPLGYSCWGMPNVVAHHLLE